MSTKNITYFGKPGLENTDAVLRLVKQRAEDLNIDRIVLASTRGGTAEKALDVLEGKKLIIVGISRERFSADTMKRAENRGFPVLFSNETDYNYPEDMKTAFRRFSQGMKVAVEDVVIACRKGVLKEGEDVISLAGSSWGADTVIVINAASEFSTVKIKEVICMPR